MTTATALKRAADQATGTTSSAANDGKAVVNHAVQSIQKLPTNVEATHKSDARLTVITETISHITSMNDPIACSIGVSKIWSRSSVTMLTKSIFVLKKRLQIPKSLHN
jgi:hypothetical protein